MSLVYNKMMRVAGFLNLGALLLHVLFFIGAFLGVPPPREDSVFADQVLEEKTCPQTEERAGCDVASPHSDSDSDEKAANDQHELFTSRPVNLRNTHTNGGSSHSKETSAARSITSKTNMSMSRSCGARKPRGAPPSVTLRAAVRSTMSAASVKTDFT